jgi:hypothetical protein
MTCLAGLLLMAPISVLAEKESPLAGPNVANLTAAIQYADLHSLLAKKTV